LVRVARDHLIDQQPGEKGRGLAGSDLADRLEASQAAQRPAWIR
jgi:hypothetical protein